MEELVLRVDELYTLFQQVESHLSDTITWFIAVFFGSITVVALALVFLVKASIQRGIDKSSDELKKKLSEMEKQLDVTLQKQKDFDNFYEGYRIVDGEREYFAPPMNLFTPYRTTEKIFGNRPVYTTLIGLGLLASETWKSIECPLENVDTIIRSSFICSGEYELSSCKIEPLGKSLKITVQNEAKYAKVEDCPQAYIQIWYTKTLQNCKE